MKRAFERDDVAREVEIGLKKRAEQEANAAKTPSVNYGFLRRQLRRKRDELKMSLRDVADVTNVSASTLSRLERGIEIIETENLLKLLVWLDLDFSAVVSMSSDIAPLIQIEKIIADDASLSPEAREGILKVIAVMYKFFSER